MTTINQQYTLATAEGDSRQTTGTIAIAHSTATTDAPALNISRNMKNDFNNAYVHFNVDDANVYQVGTPGYVAWGAGAIANPLSRGTLFRPPFVTLFRIETPLFRRDNVTFLIPTLLLRQIIPSSNLNQTNRSASADH